MGTNDVVLPIPGSFSFHSSDPASSGLDFSSHTINPILLNRSSSNLSIAPTSASNTFPSEILSLAPAPSSSAATDTPFVSDPVPLNNATNNYSDIISAQPLLGHGAYFHSSLQSLTEVGQNATENMPPSQSVTVSSGSKRKADFNENCSGPNLKKARTLPITQKPSQIPVIIPPQLQEHQDRSQLTLQIPNQQPKGGFNSAKGALIAGVGDFDVPPEIAAIEIELNGLISFPIVPSIKFPSCCHLLTTVIAREDVEKIERRFYPYLWFPGREPYMLQGQDYNNILAPPLVGAMKKALQRINMDCGTLALTASSQLVLFFQGEDKKAALDAVAKSMGQTFCNSARWRGVMEIPGQNNVVAFMGHHIQQDAQGSSGSNASQSDTGQSGHSTEQHPQSGPSSHLLPDDSTTTQQTQATTVSPQSQGTVSHYRPSVDSQAAGESSNSAVAEPSTSSRKRSATPRQPAQNRNAFVLVGNDTAKRRRNGPPPGVPILMPVPDTPQGVSGPPTSYPTNTVFVETHTKESFPHPQNTNSAALSGPKKKTRRRAPTKSHAKGQNAPTTMPQPQLEPGREVMQKPKARGGKRLVKNAQNSESQLEPGGEVVQKPKARSGKRRVKNAHDSESPRIQAGPSGTGALESKAPEIQPIYSVSQQVSNNILCQALQEDAQVSQVSSSYTLYQVGYAGNVGESVPFSSVVTSQIPAPLTTDQVGLAAAAAAASILEYTQYSNAMTCQSLASQETNQLVSADTLGGGYYAPLSATTTNQTSQVAYPDIPGGYDQFSTTNTAQSSISHTSNQTGYADPIPALSTANQAALPNIVTEYETGGATTSQSSVSQPSDQVTNIEIEDFVRFIQLFAACRDEPQVPAQAPYPDVPVYPPVQFDGQQVDNQDQGQASLSEPDIAAIESGHNQGQPSHVGVDASGNLNLANLTHQEFSDLITSASIEQNFTYDSVQQAFYLQPRDSVPGFSGSSAGEFTGEPFDGQTWNFN